MAHRNARLTVHGRRLLVHRVEVEGWSVAASAEAAGVSRATVYKWLRRWRTEGEADTLSRDFQQTLATHRLEHITTRPFRPQTNGKVERFNRTLVDEFAYARVFTSNQARLDALPRWLRYYNQRRRHTALDGHTPLEIVNNLCGKNS